MCNLRKSSEVSFYKSVDWIDGHSLIVDSFSTDGKEEAKEIFDSGKIEGENTFPEASWPDCMAYVDCSSIIGKRHSYTVLLFLDAIHPSARPG